MGRSRLYTIHAFYLSNSSSYLYPDFLFTTLFLCSIQNWIPVTIFIVTNRLLLMRKFLLGKGTESDELKMSTKTKIK